MLMSGATLFAMPHPAERTRRPIPRVRSARPNTYAKKYGPTNVSLFELLDALPIVAPHRAAKLRYLLEEKDPFGEWCNAYEQTDAVRSMRVALETLPHDYEASASYIRAYRPRRANDALKFWNSPLARAHALNAVLLRGDRPMSLVHKDLDLKHDKLYTQFPSWGVDFKRPTKRSTLCILQDAAGERHDARVVSMCRDTATAQLRLEGLSLQIEGRYDPRGRIFRTSAVLQLSASDLIPATVAASVLGLTEAGVLSVLPVLCTNDRRAPLVEARHLARVVPEELHRMTVPEALAAANPCRCAFFDVQQGGCGFGYAVPLSGTAAYSCGDHRA